MSASHQTVNLRRGRHLGPEQGACVMELASMLAGERFSDHPRSVCRVLGALLRGCNDRFDDATRQRLYPYAAEAVGTAGDRTVSRRRLAICIEAAADRGLRAPRRARGARLERFVEGIPCDVPPGSEGDAALLALVDRILAVAPSRLGGIELPAAPRAPERAR